MSTLPRLHSHPNPYASTAYPASTTSSTYDFPTSSAGPSTSYGAYASGPSRRNSYYRGGSGGGFPKILKRMFKFPQMDFEVAIWEMTHLMVAPRKVFRNLYYQRQTKSPNTPHDPALPYLTLLFQLLAGLAWSLAYSPSHTIAILSSFLLIQSTGYVLLLSTLSFYLIPKLFGPGGLLRDWQLGSSGRTLLGKRRRGLFRNMPVGEDGEGGGFGWGYAFDVSLRSYVPLLIYLSLLQFLLMPLISTPSGHTYLSATLSNVIHGIAFTHALYVMFLGYSALPFLQNTQVLLVPGVAVVWGTVVVMSAVGVGMTGRRGMVGWVPGLSTPPMPPPPPADVPSPPPPPPDAGAPPPRMFMF
ncbi:MAG: hypothetical protein Q9159_005363 [Coniocarpon cinnabarinum]